MEKNIYKIMFDAMTKMHGSFIILQEEIRKGDNANIELQKRLDEANKEIDRLNKKNSKKD